MERGKTMPPEEVFSRTLFGILMVVSTFIPGGRWVTFILGILFLISAFQGFCVTCYLYKKFHPQKGVN